MNMFRLKESYLSGEIEKQDYIARMLRIHEVLFQYSEFISGTDIEKIEIDSKGPLFHLRGMNISMECPEDEARVAPIEILNFNRYEPTEIAAIETVLDAPRQIIDIGANIGWFSLWFAKKYPAAHIHAFEPLPANFKFLVRNIARNNLSNRITPYNYGCSDKGGVFDFYLCPEASTNASLQNVSGSEKYRRISGLTIPLDEWIDNYGITPEFIKCDVEGAEFLVFKGGTAVLEKDSPIVFTEMLRKWSRAFGYHPNEIIRFFNEIGYSCFSISEAGCKSFHSMDDHTLETNFIFLHREKHRKKIEKLQKD